jgi:hypothetical protein
MSSSDLGPLTPALSFGERGAKGTSLPVSTLNLAPMLPPGEGEMRAGGGRMDWRSFLRPKSSPAGGGEMQVWRGLSWRCGGRSSGSRAIFQPQTFLRQLRLF